MSNSIKENLKTNIFPYDFVKENEVIAFQNGKGIVVSSPKPISLNIYQEIQRFLNSDFKVELCDSNKFNEILTNSFTSSDHQKNISEELIHSLINPFINLKSTDFFEKIKLFNKDQISVCSLIFLKILNHYLRSNLNNKKLYKYLLKLHSDYLTDVDESLKFNTLTNDLISIYFTRLNSNLIKYV